MKKATCQGGLFRARKIVGAVRWNCSADAAAFVEVFSVFLGAVAQQKHCAW